MDPRTVSIPDLVHPIYEAVDTAIGRVLEEEKVSCKLGCTACCHQLFIATLPEVIAIAAWIRGEKRKELWELAAAPNGRPDLAALVDPGVMNMDAYFDRHIPCRFLSRDKRCEIYPVRPLACRTYYVITPAEVCGGRTIDKRRVQILELFAKDGRRLKEAAAETLDDLAFQLGLPIAIGWFPVLMAYATNRIDAFPGPPGVVFEPKIREDQLSVLEMARIGAARMGLENLSSKTESQGRYEPSEGELTTLDNMTKLREEVAGGQDQEPG